MRIGSTASAKATRPGEAARSERWRALITVRIDRPRTEAQQGQRWLTELPLAFHNGTAMLPLKIEKEPPRRSAEGTAGPLWGVRFALDVETRLLEAPKHEDTQPADEQHGDGGVHVARRYGRAAI